MTQTEINNLVSLRNGSHKTFCRLYEEYAPLLYNFTYDLCRSKELSHDIVQDTFLKVWVNRYNINIERSFKSYIFTIAKNRFIDLFRGRINNQKYCDYLLEYKKYDENGISLDFEDFLRELNRAKESLTPREREIFELSKEEGFSAKEIAEKLNISEQVVFNQTSIATRKLKDMLKNYALLFVVFFG